MFCFSSLRFGFGGGAGWAALQTSRDFLTITARRLPPVPSLMLFVRSHRGVWPPCVHTIGKLRWPGFFWPSVKLIATLDVHLLTVSSCLLGAIARHRRVRNPALPLVLLFFFAQNPSVHLATTPQNLQYNHPPPWPNSKGWGFLEGSSDWLCQRGYTFNSPTARACD